MLPVAFKGTGTAVEIKSITDTRQRDGGAFHRYHGFRCNILDPTCGELADLDSQLVHVGDVLAALP